MDWGYFTLGACISLAFLFGLIIGRRKHEAELRELEADLEQAKRNYAALRSELDLFRACQNISDDNIDLLRSEIADLRAAIDAVSEKKAVESSESEAEQRAKKRADEIQRVFDEGLSNILNYGPKTARKAVISGGNDKE